MESELTQYVLAGKDVIETFIVTTPPHTAQPQHIVMIKSSLTLLVNL